MVATYEYDVFGALRQNSGPADTAFRYTGEQWDSETGFYYLRARYYDPATGRFLTHDPWRAVVGHPQSLNRYPYVVNNPVSLVDPSGLCVAGIHCPGPVQDVVDAAGNAVQCAGNGFDCVEDALESVGDHLDDLGYLDVNATGCLGFCVAVGFQASFGEGFHPYAGGRMGSPQLSGNVTVAPGQHITTGWNCGGQVAIGGLLAPTVQLGGAGGHRGKEGNVEWETEFAEAGVSVGLSPFGAGTATCVYIW